MKKINVVVDIETLSLRPDAAIISIAALPFRMDAESIRDDEKYGYTGVPAYDEMIKSEFSCPDEYAPFHASVDATSCAMAGLAFDMDTVKFWSDMPDAAKQSVLNQPRQTIREALEDFISYLEVQKSRHETDELIIWIQGSDFDIPILKNAMYSVLGLTPNTLPWKHRNIRDARTFILEALSIEYPELPVNELYGKLCPYGDLIKHNSLHDCIWTALNIIHVRKTQINIKLNGAPGEENS